jgi:hypothetical protein
MNSNPTAYAIWDDVTLGNCYVTPADKSSLAHSMFQGTREQCLMWIRFHEEKRTLENLIKALQELQERAERTREEKVGDAVAYAYEQGMSHAYACAAANVRVVLQTKYPEGT